MKWIYNLEAMTCYSGSIDHSQAVNIPSRSLTAKAEFEDSFQESSPSPLVA